MVKNENKISILLILNERTIKSTCFLYIKLKVFFFYYLVVTVAAFVFHAKQMRL